MSGEAILIVDDNPANLKLFKVLLTLEGYKTSSAANSEEMYEKLKTFKPDLILMDIQLPGLDGLALTRQLKADPAYKHIRILAITAYAIRGDEQKALQAGCDGYISKPIDTNELPKIIKNFFEG